MRIEARQKKVKLRKNFLPTLFITILLWLLLAVFVNSVNPFSFGVVFLFLVLVFLALFFTFAFLFTSTKRAVVYSIAAIIFLVLRYFGIGNVLNLLIIIGLIITIEIYFFKKS